MNVRSSVLVIVACLSSFMPVAHAQGEALPPGVIRAGSLANHQLIIDIKVGVAAKVAAKGCSKRDSLEQFVVAMPSGKVGSRRWKERWMVTGCGQQYPIDIDFIEDGPDAANWTIAK